jgi:hypothetical protein
MYKLYTASAACRELDEPVSFGCIKQAPLPIREPRFKVERHGEKPRGFVFLVKPAPFLA